MSEKVPEDLSAVMDGEADELSLRRVLARSDDPDLRATWTRYHLARDALHASPALRPPVDLSIAVRALIDGEPAPRRSGRLRAVASFAVAASLTAVVVLGGRELIGVSDPDTPPGLVNGIGAAPVRASLGSRPEPVPAPALTTPYDDLARERLRRYSQEHAEHAALNTPQGLIPYARVPELAP